MGTYNYLAHTLPLNNNVTTTFVDPYVEGSFEATIQENTKAIFVETLGNPNSNVIDIAKDCEIAHKHGLPLVVDSTFAAPYLIRPIKYGARHCRTFSNEIYRWTWRAAIGGVIVDGENSTGKHLEDIHGSPEANPSYHGVSFAEAAGALQRL